MLMRIASIKLLAILMMFVNIVLADNPAYQDGLLTIPSIDTVDKVGNYQDVSFNIKQDGTWQLVNFKELDNKGLTLAPVKNVEVITTNTFPVQVFLKISGAFNSGCGDLGPVNQRFVGNKFEVSFNAIFPFPMIYLCTQNIRPFVKTIPLSVYGLSAGAYSYSVNGKTGSFNLAADNKLTGDCDGRNC
jgi:hypothetical protein